MMNWRIVVTALAVFGIFLVQTDAALADGIIIPMPPPDRPIRPIPMLSVKYHHVTVSIDNQVAITSIDQVFVNESNYELEGAYIFPLPEQAAISEFAMYVDGERLEGEVLDRDEARRIYEDIVRKQRDPALLEYMGRNAFRARIYPIAPHSEKRVQLEYTEILPMDNGLIRYVYPLDTERFSAKPIEDVSIHIDIRSGEAIKSVYSPSHDIAIERDGDYRASVGYEDHDVKPDTDFSLYYSVSSEDVGLNLLSYRPQRNEDGFFLMLVSPAVEVDEQEVVAKDIVLVLDLSGSMRGEKLSQAKEALKFILDNLNDEDRFNIIAFSTGLRRYAADLRPAQEKEDAWTFVEELRAAGGTNIERALVEALSMSERDRPQVVIFLTDGLATEGVTDTQKIIDSVNKAAREDVRLFAFGIGDEVNTILLDTIAQAHRGATNYVRPGQDIRAEVTNFYAKISTPVLANLRLDYGDMLVEDVYPDPLPDLFVGSQLVVVGRYRDGGHTTITLSGEVNDRSQQFTYEDISFRDKGGEYFIARLWATRRIGYLLGQIRLHGEDKELVEEIVDLAVAYGIVTPYTSFLIQEDMDILSPAGRASVAQDEFQIMSATPRMEAGAEAVARSVEENRLRKADKDTIRGYGDNAVKTVADKTFVNRGGKWTDTTYDESKMTPIKIQFGSEEYFNLLATDPRWGRYLALDKFMIVVLDGQAYEIEE